VTTMADMIASTKRMAYGSLSEQMNLISATALAGATELECELSVEGISPGTLVSSGLNVWWVKGLNAATNTLYVVPGYEGSPQAAVAIGDFLMIRPRVTDWYIFDELNSTIRSLSAPSNGLYREATFELDAETVYQTYEIPTEAQSMVSIIEIRALVPASPDEWVPIPTEWWKWQADQNLIRLLAAIPASSRLQVVYKAPFVAATALTDDPVDDLGLSETMLDIPPLGVTVTLLRTTESRRMQPQAQGDPRRAAEVSAGGNASIAREFARDFRQRIDDEYLRQVKRTGIYRGV
jgi:hypothetical protein